MSQIFKAYDIRGVYPDELNEETALKIGYALGQEIPGPTFLVGEDMRLSSLDLSAALVKGLQAAGKTVHHMGLTTSPRFYFAVQRGHYDGGVMVTASHLPSEFNGFKCVRKDAVPLSGTDGLPELERRVREMNAVPRLAAVAPRRVSFVDAYRDFISAQVQDPRPLRVVVDAGNGSVGPEIRGIFKNFPLWTLTAMYFEPDGRFPHHVANPLISKNTQAIRERVVAEGADLGVAFDGDADRVGFIDEHGVKIPEDLVTALLAIPFLDHEPGAAVLYDLRSSRVVAETIHQHGGRPIRSRVGHSFIKQTMREQGAVFGGEMSGHYYFKDTGFTDNAVRAMVQMFNLLALQNRPLSELVRPLAKYQKSGEINLRVRDKPGILASVQQRFSEAQCDRLDGLTVQDKDWWFNLRPSNTEALLRLNVEAVSGQVLQEKVPEVLDAIRSADPSAERAG